jgi:hypothetical protein
MVLEISVNGGVFSDITSGGNAFIAGGYNADIDWRRSAVRSPVARRGADSPAGTTGPPPLTSPRRSICPRRRPVSRSSFAGGAARDRQQRGLPQAPPGCASTASRSAAWRTSAAPSARSRGSINHRAWLPCDRYPDSPADRPGWARLSPAGADPGTFRRGGELRCPQHRRWPWRSMSRSRGTSADGSLKGLPGAFAPAADRGRRLLVPPRRRGPTTRSRRLGRGAG